MMKYDDLEKYITKERLKTYLDNAGNNENKAIELYEWNTAISEALYTPLSYFEITLRNICNEKLRKEAGEDWYLDENILGGLNKEKGKWAINKITEAEGKVIKRKTEKKIPNRKTTLGDIVSNLEFSFWSNLFCDNYDRTIWKPYLQYLFKKQDRKIIYRQIKSINDLRNRIFHHEPIIFDNRLEDKYRLIVELLCITSNTDVCNYVRGKSNFEKVFQEYKKFKV